MEVVLVIVTFAAMLLIGVYLGWSFRSEKARTNDRVAKMALDGGWLSREQYDRIAKEEKEKN